MLKDYFTTKNVIFLLMVILLIKFFSQITATALLFFAAYVFACSINPLVDRLSTKLKRPIAASIVMSGIILVLFAVFLPLLVIAARQIEQLITMLPQQFTNIKSFILNKQIFGQSIVSMIDLPSIIDPVTKFTRELVGQSITITIGFASALIYLLALCVITYYFIVDKETIRKGFMLLLPDHLKEKADNIINTISAKIGKYILAQLTVITSVGICVMIPFLLLRIDCAILLGVLSAILDLIPVIGPTIALIICIIMCYHYGPLMLSLVILFFLLAQWIENNFVRSYIFGKFLDLHPLIIFFALFVTAKFFGAIGVVFAPAIAATVCVLLDELYIKPIHNQIE